MILSQPLFLIALVAIALPIAVHLFNFRRYKKVYFSNVEYLHELQTETKKQSKLREYLILATRILSIVFLVLAFCQPVIPNKESPIKGGGSVVSVYVDNSFSMENSGNDGSLIESAKQKAREIAAAYQPSDQFQLLTNDMEGSQ
ncbi:MAG: BatA domain-containing protein, partial [Bacteroidales bacterium]|nr:BatA domain-containing protein [Bacteroidales bacterium]